MTKKAHRFIFAVIAAAIANVMANGDVAYGLEKEPGARNHGSAAILAGSSLSYGYGIAAHKSGDVFIAGKARSIDWPVKPRIFGIAPNRNRDYAYIAQLDRDLSAIFAVVILNGSGNDAIHKITFDRDGSLVVLGHTSSPDLPEVLNSKESYRGKTDVFVARFNTSLDKLLGFKMLGGSDYDYGRAMVVAPSQDIYVTGVTASAEFPVTPNAYNKILFEPRTENKYSYGLDTFVTRLSPSLDRIKASTLYGKIDDQHVYDIALDEKQNVYIIGTSFQKGVSLTSDADNAGGRGGVLDLFIAKFDAELADLVAATSWGGSDQEYARGIQVRGGYIYVSGYSQSVDFPWTMDALQRRRVGSLIDSFVVKITDDLKKIIYSSLIGGVGLDFNRGLGFTHSGSVVLFGNSNSGTSFPRARELTPGSSDLGDYGFYASVLNENLKPLRTFIFGGRGREQIFDLIPTPGGDIYAVGTSSSQHIDGARLLTGPLQGKALNVLVVRLRDTERVK